MPNIATVQSMFVMKDVIGSDGPRGFLIRL